MDAGWIKAHRQMLEHPLLQRADAMGLWMRLLLLAAHRPTQVHFRSQAVLLTRGQCAIVLSDLAEKVGITRQRMRTIVNAWRNDRMLEVNQAQGKAFSVVTICNFDTYQALALPSAEVEQPRKNQAPTKQQPTEQGSLLENGKDSPLLSPQPDEPEPSPPKSKGKPDAKARAVQMPTGFALSSDMVAYAERKCPGIDAERTFEQFTDHHRSKGSRFVDWPAAWRTWVNSPYGKPMRGGCSPRGSPPRASIEGTMRILHESGFLDDERPEDEPDSGGLDAAPHGLPFYGLN